MTQELVIDSFAGGGGASEGIRTALGVPEPKRQVKHGLSYTPEYRVWQTMRLRCMDPANAAYANYGGRGIAICDRWRDSLAAFVTDMGPKPTPKHEIDRIDNSKDYEPGNCRWATRVENSRNRRNNRVIEFRGETLVLTAWCERLGLPKDTVAKRLAAGWAVEAALTTPVRPKAANGTGERYGRILKKLSWAATASPLLSGLEAAE